MLNIYFDKHLVITKNKFNLSEINADICSTGLSIEDYYLIHNGKILNLESNVDHGDIQIALRICGGKGGFGSMLRAIGAQIEKTTNREACRDLSGRRLRDINEEKRLKKWITEQSERERAAAERKQKKLEKLCEEPKYVFQDNEYNKERAQLLEVVEDAVVQGLKKANSTVGVKRKKIDSNEAKKKRKLWIDDEIDDVSSSGDEESDVEDIKQSSVESLESSSHDTVINVKSENEDLSNKSEEQREVNHSENSNDSEKNSDKTPIETQHINVSQTAI